MEKDISSKLTNQCPRCGSLQYMVIDSRKNRTNNYIRRRKECLKCNAVYTTYEIDKKTLDYLSRCIKEVERIKSLDALIDEILTMAEEMKKIGDVLGGFNENS